MAFSHGSKAKFKLADSADTLTDISTYLDSVDMEGTVDTAETSTYGTDSKTHLAGMIGRRMNLSGMYDPTIDALISGILGPFSNPKAFEYDPQGIATGTPKFTGNAIVASYKVTSPLKDVVKFALVLEVTGVVTRATNP